MIDNTALQLGATTERERILALLAMAPDGAISLPILKAITDGTPAAVFACNQRARRLQPERVAGGGKWSAITSRLNAQRRDEQVMSDTQ